MFAYFVNNTFLCIGIMIVNTKEDFSLELVGNLLADHFTFVIIVMIGCCFFIWMLMELFNSEKYNLLKSCYDKNTLQSQYQQILENMDQAIITDTDYGLKYFNSVGFDFLKEQARMCNENEKS